jgi:hypothetical protein
LPRGGRRAGRPGTLYPQRSDLRRPLPPTAPTGLPYGQHAALVDAQRQVPMGPAGPPAPGSAAPPPAAPPPPVLPGSLGAFDRPSERAGEPVTAGLPTGPGPGPEVLGAMNPTHDELRALYRAFPNEDLRELLEDIDTGV